MDDKIPVINDSQMIQLKVAKFNLYANNLFYINQKLTTKNHIIKIVKEFSKIS